MLRSSRCEPYSGISSGFRYPDAWVGIEPVAVAAGLADALIRSLRLTRPICFLRSAPIKSAPKRAQGGKCGRW